MASSICSNAVCHVSFVGTSSVRALEKISIALGTLWELYCVRYSLTWSPTGSLFVTTIFLCVKMNVNDYKRHSLWHKSLVGWFQFEIRALYQSTQAFSSVNGVSWVPGKLSRDAFTAGLFTWEPIWKVSGETVFGHLVRGFYRDSVAHSYTPVGFLSHSMFIRLIPTGA